LSPPPLLGYWQLQRYFCTCTTSRYLVDGAHENSSPFRCFSRTLCRQFRDDRGIADKLESKTKSRQTTFYATAGAGPIANYRTTTGSICVYRRVRQFVAILGDPAQRQRLSLAIDHLRKDAEDVILPLRPIVTERYYGSNPGNVGLFPNPLPEKLTEFYSRLETLRVNLDRYLEYMPKGELSASDAIRMLEYIGSNTDACVNGGRALTTQLEALRDGKG
jgi:hypothetical protein